MPTNAERGDTQDLPIPNDRVDIQTLVIADIEKRRAVGIERYGTALQTFNGRSALLDLYEELIDGTMYARQRLEEERELVRIINHLLDCTDRPHRCDAALHRRALEVVSQVRDTLGADGETETP